MTSKLLPFLALTVSTLLVSTAAQAADAGQSVLPQPREVRESSEWRPHVGVIVGAAQPEGSGDTNSELGIDVGYQPYIPFGLGAEYIHSRVDDGTETKDRDTVWAKGTYNFGGTIPVIKDSYVGVGVGAVFKSDRTSVAGAPIVGFDIPIQKDEQRFLSVGASSRYAVVSDGDVDTFSLNGVVKYWY